MRLTQPPLYAKLYLWFVVITVALGLTSFLAVLALGQRRTGPPRQNHGIRMVNHLARALSGASPAGLQDAIEGIHDDLEVDVAVLDRELNVRARAGQPFQLPPAPQIERARQKAAWMLPNWGIVAGPLDGGLLLLRFPTVAAQRHRTRRLVQLLMGLAVAAALLYPLSRSITRPLEHLTKVAERFGKGDLSARSGIDRQDEVGQLARTFDEMAARIEATRRAERELLANVSHELRTPLARLQLALELLDAKDEAARRRVASIREEVDELDRLVGDVLTTSRLELSALPLQKRPLAVRDVAAKAIERALSLHPGLGIEMDVPADLRVNADEKLLGRVLDNLLDNAHKYGDGKGVKIEARRDGGSALVAVEDGGPGIPAEDLEKVFEPFFRGSAARASAATGFGLGLALARRVAEAHGGAIKAANTGGGGARFELRLPEVA